MSAVCIGASFLLRGEIYTLPIFGRCARKFMHNFDGTTDTPRWIYPARTNQTRRAQPWQRRYRHR